MATAKAKAEVDKAVKEVQTFQVEPMTRNELEALSSLLFVRDEKGGVRSASFNCNGPPNVMALMASSIGGVQEKVLKALKAASRGDARS